MKKFLIITYYWPPSGGAGVQRWLKLSNYFPEFNFQPIVITVDGAFASYPVLDESLLKEVPENLKVIRTKTKEPFGIYKKLTGKKQIPSGGFSSGNSSSFKDALMRFFRGNFFIPDARMGWNKFAYEAACEIIRKEKPDAIITSSPPHSTQLIGLKLKEQFGIRIPWIADMRDPWTDIYYYKKLLHTPIAKWIDKNYERKVLENADKVVVVSESIRQSFIQKSKRIKPENLVVIPNGYDEKDFVRTDSFGDNKVSVKTENRFIITYTGTIAESYSPYPFFSAIEKLIKNNSDANILFRFIGSMPKEMQDLLKLISWNGQFEYIPYSPHEKVVEYMLASSVLYLAIPQSEGNKGILTGKLFEYLAARKPIIATGPVDGDAATIISSCNAGKMFEANDEKGILMHLQHLLNEWRSNKNLLTESDAYKKYSRKILAGKFSELLNKIIH
ncbi:MAG: glycosyltransferase family 4 protein [Bacteroidetes bacterium]|nr:glycosyltransferase family 4 protein [Bacteroidota bacterium]